TRRSPRLRRRDAGERRSERARGDPAHRAGSSRSVPHRLRIGGAAAPAALPDEGDRSRSDAEARSLSRPRVTARAPLVGMTGDRPSSSPRRGLDPSTVAVVDDNRDFAENLAELLEDNGFSTISAATAAEARDRIAAARPGVALVDLNLPDGDGL